MSDGYMCKQQAGCNRNDCGNGLARICKHNGEDEMVRQLKDKIERLQARVKELEDDATRYRWLRKQHWNESIMCVVTYPKDSVKPGYDCPSLNRLDTWIDKLIVE